VKNEGQEEKAKKSNCTDQTQRCIWAGG